MNEPTLVMVVCNEAHRLEPLLQHVRPFFEHIVICVQTSTDGTREIVERYADVLIDDERAGFGDRSMPLVQRRVETRWAFRVDADEWPTESILVDLPRAVEFGNARNLDGIWIPFRSWVQDVEWEVPHSHFRLWQNSIRWPPTLHSRPPSRQLKEHFWEVGHILHRKTLDEHVRGYLDYLSVSGDNQSWISHNLVMIEAACRGSAGRYGWEFVEGHEWWPTVRDRVFGGSVADRFVAAEP